MASVAQTVESVERYLDPQVLARIHRLDLRTRLVVEGFMAGLHRSPYKGLSVEFAQHREYAPGDDTRFIDWKVYSRTDRYFLKQYEADTNLWCTFLVDASESMKYTGATQRRQGLSKYDYAAALAASLALLLLRQQDAVGITVFDEDLVASLRPSANPGQIKSFCHLLEQSSRSLRSKTCLDTVCHTVAGQLSHRGIVCVISDLFVQDEKALMTGLLRLLHRGHDVLVMQVLDEDELTFPFDGNTRFEGLEQGGHLVGEARVLREGYMEAMAAFLSRVKGECTRNRISYEILSTNDHLGAALARFLAQRSAFGRRAAGKRH